MIKVGIIGGAGYTAGELIRILIHHKHAEITFVQSTSNAGKPIASVHSDLLGDLDLTFSQSHHSEIDVLFSLPEAREIKKFLDENIHPDTLRIIDLSHDFRLERTDNDFTYGLPELQREAIKKSNRIANPGCFATAIQLGVLPLAQENKLIDEVHVQAITGSTGAGVIQGSTTHFSWRKSNVSSYKSFQ